MPKTQDVFEQTKNQGLLACGGSPCNVHLLMMISCSVWD